MQTWPKIAIDTETYQWRVWRSEKRNDSMTELLMWRIHIKDSCLFEDMLEEMYVSR